jgi:hypothetical protein
MDKFFDVLCSPKIGIILGIPLIAYLLSQGCSGIASKSGPRRG